MGHPRSSRFGRGSLHTVSRSFRETGVPNGYGAKRWSDELSLDQLEQVYATRVFSSSFLQNYRGQTEQREAGNYVGRRAFRRARERSRRYDKRYLGVRSLVSTAEKYAKRTVDRVQDSNKKQQQ